MHEASRQTLDALPAPAILVDAAGTILFANAAAERAFGKKRTELGATALEALLAPESRALLHEALSEALATAARGPAPRDVFAPGVAAERLAFELSCGRIEGGDAPAVVALLRDVTEQRRAEERQAAAAADARAKREQLEALFGFAPAFIIAVSKTGTIEFINRVLPQYRKEDVIGTNWLAFFPPELHARMEAVHATVFATGSNQTYETSSIGPDGRMIHFESQIAPVHSGEQVVSAVLVSQDVTEKKRVQAELLAGRHMALLGTLAAGVAHEINTPIQYVGDSILFLRDSGQNLLRLLDKLAVLRESVRSGTPIDRVVVEAAAAEDEADLSYLRENMPLAFESCVEGLGRVSTIVRSLKEFAHPSEKEMVPADLNHTIESALIIASSEYKFVANLERDLAALPTVMCHPSEISQVVLNIVVNAAHAIGDVVRGTDRKGTITVSSRQEGDTVVLAIRDTGGGIPESFVPRIFDPFFTTKEVGKGTGQGLAIAWSMVKDRHGGELTFETKVGEGTTFFIRLPIANKAK